MSENHLSEMMNEQILQAMIQDHRASDLMTYIEEKNPIDVATSARDFDDDLLWHMCSLLSAKHIALVLEQADDDLRQGMVQAISNSEILDVFAYMQKDDIVDIIGDLPIGRRKYIINQMKSSDRNIINTLLEYADDSAGGIMTTAYIALREDLTIQEGLEKIRNIATKTEVIETIFVVNARGQLIGIADLRDLLITPKQTTIAQIMKENVISVHPDLDQEEAARLVSKYDLNAIPVVNSRNAILGIITVDDIIDVIVEEYNEDILELGGVSSEESLDTTLSQSIKLRLPWLLINLLTAFLASITVKGFESTIVQVVALSSTMTIVSGMGGNAGTQTTSIMVRQLAIDDVKLSKYFHSFLKEILLGVVNGGINGLVTGVVVAMIYRNFFLGLIIFIAMIGNLVVAGIFGFLVPLFLKKIHADPAVASSIFVTTATDVLGFFIFLSLAALFLPVLK